MRGLEKLHPVTELCYFAGVMSIGMLSLHPALIALSLLGCTVLLLLQGRMSLRTAAAGILIFLLMSLLNPLFYHDGVTVLFVINDRPFTLEAFLYGMAASGMIVGMIGWFRLLSGMLTSDKLMYLLGGISPSFALTVSMALRFVPLFARQGERIHRAQLGLGLYRDENLPDAAAGRAREFSILTTWALENGVITADSMAARGYGTGRRTRYAIFRFTRADAAFLSVSLILTAAALWGIFGGSLRFEYYPEITLPEHSLLAQAAMAAYGMLCLLPVLAEGGERIQWHCLRSKI